MLLRLSKLSSTTLALLAFVLAAVVMMSVAYGAALVIESRTQKVVTAKLAEAGIDWITVDTDGGTLELSQGGSALSTPDGVQASEDEEYPALYDHFGRLVREERSHVDVAPLRLANDALLLGSIERVEELNV